MMAGAIHAQDAFRVKVTGHGKPMILIPGLSSSGEVWDTTVARYKDRFECHVLTLAGFAGVPRIEAPMLEKVREGIAVSVKMDKTVVVAVVDRVRHRRYQKTMQRTKRLYAHDEANDVREGDRVRIAETRRLSRQKRWRVVEVLERAR